METTEESRLFVRRLLNSMEKWGASDIFLTEGKVPAARVGGTVVQVDLVFE